MTTYIILVQTYAPSPLKSKLYLLLHDNKLDIQRLEFYRWNNWNFIAKSDLWAYLHKQIRGSEDKTFVVTWARGSERGGGGGGSPVMPLACFANWQFEWSLDSLTAVGGNTSHGPNAVLMLAQRLRRYPHIETTLGLCMDRACCSRFSKDIVIHSKSYLKYDDYSVIQILIFRWIIKITLISKYIFTWFCESFVCYGLCCCCTAQSSKSPPKRFLVSLPGTIAGVLEGVNGLDTSQFVLHQYFVTLSVKGTVSKRKEQHWTSTVIPGHPMCTVLWKCHKEQQYCQAETKGSSYLGLLEK